ncbi:MAG: 3-keto-5-aminohexanoate cleavage protein [Acidisphaera sp.]|nr:3-keto-5-aminohexanoate cleavage protein [Acidisphaera sp.]
MIVQACLNGDRPSGYHPRLPVSPEAIVADAMAAVAAGAAELHIHGRDSDGRETLAPEVVDPLVATLRARLPGTLLGLSTGAWIEQDEDRRLACIGAWRQCPDHVSVNLAEAGAPAVIERLWRRGIGVEAGLTTIADAERLARLGLGGRALRVLIEIAEPEPPAALALAGEIEVVLARAGLARPILLHGQEATVWPLVRRAAERRFSTRVGLEDGKALPDGAEAPDNAALVAAALRIFGR